MRLAAYGGKAASVNGALCLCLHGHSYKAAAPPAKDGERRRVTSTAAYYVWRAAFFAAFFAASAARELRGFLVTSRLKLVPEYASGESVVRQET